MLRALALLAARATPNFARQWMHRHNNVYNALRRLFGRLMGGAPVEIRSGPMKGMKLAPSEHVSHAHIRGTYELGTQQALDRLVQPGFICYDLGASIGYLSLLMARKAKHVFAFEPAPHAAAEMRRQMTVNGAVNITVVGDPVSDGEREVSFALTDVAFGSGINETQTRWPVIKLRSTTLDIFAASHPVPDLLKIDVEGEEGRVLEGARNLLLTKRPTVCCELHSKEAAEAVMRVLSECLYEVATLEGQPFAVGENIVAGDVQVIGTPRQPAEG
jgi:FkbM family methyltransferase